jgi:hypothetical protein
VSDQRSVKSVNAANISRKFSQLFQAYICTMMNSKREMKITTAWQGQFYHTVVSLTNQGAIVTEIGNL